ncbi:MAG: porin [Pseudomonadota bacterium]
MSNRVLLALALAVPLFFHPSAPALALTNAELIAIIEKQTQQIEDLNRRLSALERSSQATMQRSEDNERRAIAAERKAAIAQEEARAAERKAAAAVETSERAQVEVSNVELADPDLTFKFGPAPTLKGSDSQGRPWEFKVRGRLLVDGGALGDSDSFYTGDNATEVRSARLGVESKFFDGFTLKFETDFAGNNVDIKDGFLEYDGPFIDPLYIRAGQYKTPNSLEEQTSGRFTTFMERAAITDAFSLDRRIGLGVGATGENYGVDFGLFGQNVNVTAPSEGLAVASRGWYHDSFGGDEGASNLIHLGGSVRYRGFSNDANNNEVRYRQRPFFHFTDERSVNTGFIDNARSDVFLGGEVAWVNGPWSFQGEVANTFLQTTEGENANGLWGGYGSLSYFVTEDDSRRYQPTAGTFGRVKVNNPVQDGGWGAWEVAGRFDYLDLNSGVAQGGQQYSAIAGLNWYVNDYTRIMLNGAVTQVFNAEGDAAATGSTNTIYGVGARVQVDW